MAKMCIVCIMCMKFKEIQRIIFDDGWHLYSICGSHYQYKHKTKSGKVTIPRHGGDLNINTANSIFK